MPAAAAVLLTHAASDDDCSCNRCKALAAPGAAVTAKHQAGAAGALSTQWFTKSAAVATVHDSHPGGIVMSWPLGHPGRVAAALLQVGHGHTYSRDSTAAVRESDGPAAAVAATATAGCTRTDISLAADVAAVLGGTVGSRQSLAPPSLPSLPSLPTLPASTAASTPA